MIEWIFIDESESTKNRMGDRETGRIHEGSKGRSGEGARGRTHEESNGRSGDGARGRIRIDKMYPSIRSSINPILQDSITPFLHFSITPFLHSSITPLLHSSITPILQPSFALLLTKSDPHVHRIAPTLIPFTNCFCAKKKMKTFGSMTRSDAAISTFHSTVPEPSICDFIMFKPSVSVASSGELM